VGVVPLNANNKQEILGRYSILFEPPILINEISYLNGAKKIDEFLNGKTLKEIKGVIHFKCYPNGLELKVAQLLKTFSFGVAYSQIHEIIVNFNELPSRLTLRCDSDEVIFSINQEHLDVVEQFLENKLLSKTPKKELHQENDLNQPRVVKKPRNYRAKKKLHA